MHYPCSPALLTSKFVPRMLSLFDPLPKSIVPHPNLLVEQASPAAPTAPFGHVGSWFESPGWTGHTLLTLMEHAGAKATIEVSLQ